MITLFIYFVGIFAAENLIQWYEFSCRHEQRLLPVANRCSDVCCFARIINNVEKGSKYSKFEINKESKL